MPHPDSHTQQTKKYCPHMSVCNLTYHMYRLFVIDRYRSLISLIPFPWWVYVLRYQITYRLHLISSRGQEHTVFKQLAFNWSHTKVWVGYTWTFYMRFNFIFVFKGWFIICSLYCQCVSMSRWKLDNALLFLNPSFKSTKSWFNFKDWNNS